ncbi:MAG: 6-carboxytetrahydropterin synthase [Candidatus Caldarchaeum sp.]
MFRIQKTVHIAAAHRLVHVPRWHKCRHLHGHNYTVVVTLSCAQLQEPYEWVVDFNFISGIVKQYDHVNLDTMPQFSRRETTAENFCYVLWREISAKLPRGVKVEAVRVYETEDSWAEYTPD